MRTPAAGPHSASDRVDIDEYAAFVTLLAIEINSWQRVRMVKSNGLALFSWGLSLSWGD